MRDKIENKILIDTKFHWLILLILATGFLALGFSLDSPKNILSGLGKILFSSSVLITDYIAVGGIGAALVQNSLFIFLLLLIVFLSKTELTGRVLANVILPTGFAFFGVNFLNILPFIGGVYFYCKYKKKNFDNYISIAFNLGSLGPVFSVVAFHLGINIYFSLVLALVTCIFIGFIAPPLADICLKFHQGFTLHNVGFLAGFVGITIYSLINILALEFDRHNIIKNNTVPELKIFLGIYFLFILILGFYLTRKIGEIGRLLKNSGYNIVFLDTFGTGTIFINMGVMGLLSMGFVDLLGGYYTGPVIAGILSVFGYAAMGLHLLNTMPIVGGIILASFLANADLNSTGVIITSFFSTALAPISGKFGFLVGIFTGVLHFFISSITTDFHGGLNLYNNGFSSGLVAIIMTNLLKILPTGIFKK